jgi:hypothetical protein
MAPREVAVPIGRQRRQEDNGKEKETSSKGLVRPIMGHVYPLPWLWRNALLPGQIERTYVL